MNTVITLPRGRALTAGDLATTPDDGWRYELLDGTLIVTPTPAMHHQRASMRLVVLLASACPPGLEVFHAPFAVTLTDDTVMQPDLLVARQSDLVPDGLHTAPLLAVEIASPSTRLVDLELKKARYEAAGCPSYWIVDPDEPSVTAWELNGGAYAVAGRATGTERLTVTTPFAVSIVPARLVDA